MTNEELRYILTTYGGRPFFVKALIALIVENKHEVSTKDACFWYSVHSSIKAIRQYEVELQIALNNFYKLWRNERCKNLLAE